MTQYHAKSSNALLFHITKDDTRIGSLIYESWFRFNAVIELGSHTQYKVEPKGFWGTTIEVKQDEKVILQFKMNWKGEIVVQTYFDAIEKGFIFRHRGFFKESYVLTDTEGVEVVVMKPSFQWKIMSYEYDVTITDTLERDANRDLLLMASLHCANYYMSMVTASMGG